MELVYKKYYININIKAKSKLIYKSDLFRSYKGKLNKDLRGKVT